MWIDVTVNSCPVGKCWMAFSGGVVAVLVGGRAVGVSVGGIGVIDGGAVGLGGMALGMLVTETGVTAVLQLASARMMRLNQNSREIFLTIFSFFIQSPMIIAAYLSYRGRS